MAGRITHRLNVLRNSYFSTQRQSGLWSDIKYYIYKKDTRIIQDTGEETLESLVNHRDRLIEDKIHRSANMDQMPPLRTGACIGTLFGIGVIAHDPVNVPIETLLTYSSYGVGMVCLLSSWHWVSHYYGYWLDTGIIQRLNVKIINLNRVGDVKNEFD